MRCRVIPVDRVVYKKRKIGKMEGQSTNGLFLGPAQFRNDDVFAAKVQ
jgi:hypothetical protein